jgi:hypothetical protein
MATLTVATASRSGVDMAGASCAGGGDAFLNSGQEVVQIFNGDSGSHNVTFVTQATCDGLSVTDLVVAVAAGVTKTIGPFPSGIYNDANGLLQMTYSAVTSQTVKVLKVTPA